MANYATHSPYLLTACNHNGKKNSGFTMYSMPDKLQFELEEPFLHEKLFIGSQNGWLIVLDKHCEPFLFNPLTGESIPLPSITTLLTVRPCHSITGDIVSYFAIMDTFVEDSCPFSYYTHDDYLREITFKKVVISSNPSVVSNNFVAAALVGLISDLVVVGPGKCTWEILREEEWYMDIMFRRNGKLLCLNYHGALHEVEFKDDEFVITEMSAPFLWENYKYNLYLAEDCAGRILVILRRYDYITALKTFDVKVFRFVGGNEEESQWEHVKNLDGQAIFVGTNASVWLAKQDIHGEIRADTIYFTDDWWDHIKSDELRSRPRDICAYNLMTNSIEPCCPFEHQQCTWPLPVWIFLSNPN